jgi:signal peptidase
LELTLFESRQLTPSGEYTSGIEGPAVDAAGALYVVNFQRQGNIGKLSPGAARSELFAALPAGRRWLVRCKLNRSKHVKC